MKKNNFIEGAIIATLAIMISKALGLLYVIPFYAIIGEQGGALYGYAYNIYNIFLIISSAGIPLAISKLTSEYVTNNEKEDKYIMYNLAKKYIRIFSILSFLICFIFAGPIATLIIGDISGGNTISDVTFVIRCVSFALLIVPLLSISRGYLQGHKYITDSSISQVIEQVVRIAVILIGSFLCLKVFNLPLTYAVGISVFAAAIGAIIAYIYLLIKLKKTDLPSKDLVIKKDKQKEITQKIIGYAIPFIVINIANNLYNTTDMILLIKGLNMVGFSGTDIETISSVFTTWGSKINSIVTAIATGLVISLIPSMVASYNKKNMEEVNTFFNKTLLILLFVVLPLVTFMSLFSKEIWSFFYSDNYYGPIIIRYTILVAFFDSAYIMICCALQGLYKNKLVYKAAISGLIINALLDIPLILLFNKIGIYPYYGAITATVIGYLISLSIALYSLHKNDHIDYSKTLSYIPNIIISIILIIILSYLIKLIKFNITSKLLILVYLGICFVIIFGIYYLINRKIINYILSDKLKKKNK